jgi:macrodomain Ter protein organizer (MatP/YcbG family)
MDTDKWKSIAVPIETWKKLNQLAKENFRTVGGTITYLTEKEHESLKTETTVRVPKKRLVDEKV